MFPRIAPSGASRSYPSRMQNVPAGAAGQEMLESMKLPPSHEVTQEYNFIEAEALLAWTHPTMPTFRELKAKHPEMVVRKVITWSAVLSGELVDEYGTVSHRWMTPEVPDPNGKQLAALKKMLNQHRRIKWVWFDDWCMWQDHPKGIRTPEQKLEFDGMLAEVTCLY